jgi:hypothetical protein
MLMDGIVKQTTSSVALARFTLLKSSRHYDFPQSLTRKVKTRPVIPVTGRGGVLGCEMMRILHCLDNRLTGGGKVSTDHALLPTNITFLLLVLISVRG